MAANSNSRCKTSTYCSKPSVLANTQLISLINCGIVSRPVGVLECSAPPTLPPEPRSVEGPELEILVIYFHRELTTMV